MGALRSVGARVLKSLSSVDVGAVLVMGCWVVLMPVFWIYARFFPRTPQRVLFWTNQGFNVAPSRVRSYFVCEEFQRQGGDARVLSFWEDILGYEGLLPIDVTLAQRTVLIFRAVLAAIHDRAAIIVAQAPLYDVIGLVCLKVLYPLSVSIWTDFDDWLFEVVSFDGSTESVNLRDVLPFHAFASRGCIVSSLPLQKEMARYFKRVEIIPTFPNARMFQPSTDLPQEGNAGRVTFSWTGTFLMKHVVSDIMFLLKVLDSLNDRRIVFEVVGDGHYFQEARERASEMAKNITVSFIGWMDPKEMPAYIAAIDVGLYCLTNRDRFAESKSPTKLFEYMACAKPTVSSNFGEAARFIDHGETGFLASEFDEFVECCRALVHDPNLRVSMGRNARAKIDHEYNISVGVKRLKDLIMERVP